MLLRLLIPALLALLTSCSSPQLVPVAEGTTTPRWRIHHHTQTGGDTGPVRVDVSLASSTAQLLAKDNTVLAEMDISPGIDGHETPPGRFRVLEKLPLKRSNLYGQYVTKDTREVIVARAWEHKGQRPAGTVYQGIAMPLWLRLTSDGIGIHVGEFHRGQPSSHGCIRCPEGGQQFFYDQCRVGTPVTVHRGPHPAPSSLDAPPSAPVL
ncbi:MAG: L,D-transpeptidase [Verrucomicrobia bacterium]|nr:L,D-transpeptidase [Verrucomicrobiota bacterium]